MLPRTRGRGTSLKLYMDGSRLPPGTAPREDFVPPGQKVATTKPNYILKEWQEIANLLAIPLGVLGLITDFRRESESGRIY
jgi:hypothetical protein